MKRRGLAPDVTDAGTTFEEAVDRVAPACQALIEKLRKGVHGPEEIEVSFGLKLSAEAGAIISKASGEANFAVTMRWRSSASPS